MRIFQRGETVEIYAEVKDQDGGFAIPGTSIKVTITDPDSTVVIPVIAGDDGTMTELVAGKYVYYYTLGAAAIIGWWIVVVTVIDTGAKVTKTRGGFKVEV